MEFGGFYELPEFPCCDSTRSAFSWLTSGDKGTAVFVNDGRTAIKAVLENLEEKYRREVHVPSYLCYAVLQPFEELLLPITLYPHEHPLKPVIPGTLRKAIILIIDYFGAEPVSNEQIAEYLDQDNIVIVDNTHSLFSPDRFRIQHENFFLIASLRKMFPIPDGGIVYHHRSQFAIRYVPDGSPHPMPEAMILKRMYLDCKKKRPDPGLQHIKDHFLQIYRRHDDGKAGLEIRIRDIPFIAKEMLKQIDISRLIRRREANLDFCYRHMTRRDLFLFPRNEIHSPFMLPLIFKDEAQRDAVRQALIEKEIYPPVHWDIARVIPEKFEYEHDLSRKILSIPVDQRYDEKNMSTVVTILNKVIS
ncbi:MAG: hypothetical protein ABSG49_06015 [Methanoregula sp.]|jgi:hypothetical protein|uniref:hypothetical protein n=1 Tax=Methanoregula sp. TaxID=2052170 RepID=UPI003C29FF85